MKNKPTSKLCISLEENTFLRHPKDKNGTKGNNGRKYDQLTEKKIKMTSILSMCHRTGFRKSV